MRSLTSMLQSSLWLKCEQNVAQGEVQPKEVQGKAQFSAAAVLRVSKSRVPGAPDWLDPQCVPFQRRVYVRKISSFFL